MNDISLLNEQEKVFMAGALKAVILSGGPLTDAKLERLDEVVKKLHFRDYDEHLTEFEKSVESDEDFYFLAANLFHSSAKKLIYQVLWDLALGEGIISPDEEATLAKIKAWWKEAVPSTEDDPDF